MSLPMSLRLVLDLVACSLLLAAIAYDRLGNMAHEIIGTTMFLLLASHNIFNRRWYGTVTQRTRAPQTVLTRTINLSLLATMLTLLVTSVLISRDIFAFLPVNSTFTARQIHSLVGYLALLIASVHLGLHWTMLIGFVRGRLGFTFAGKWQTIAFRALAAAISAYGVHSLIALNVGTKLLMQPTMDFGGFETSTPAFFGNLAGIVGLFSVAAHYTLKFARAFKPA
jgi:Domain of unknown function (DUF4405)